MSTTDIRAAFEMQEKNNSSNLKRDDTGQYENPCVQSAWEGWQAALDWKAATEAAKATGTAGEPDSQFVEAWKYRTIGSGEWRVTLNEEWAKSLNQSEVIPLYSQKSMPMASSKAMSKVFKGADGLKKLADADAFWEQQPYGTRFYFGDGIADYLHREVLRAAVSDISAAPKLEIERLRDQQAERVMPMIGPLLDAFEGTQRGDLKDISASLEHWLSKINQAMVAEECPDCEGTGLRDSGGIQPWGEGINVPCDWEAARQPAPVVIPHMPEDITTDDALWRAGCKAFRAALNEMTGRDGYVVKKTYEALREHILAATNRSQP